MNIFLTIIKTRWKLILIGIFISLFAFHYNGLKSDINDLNEDNTQLEIRLGSKNGELEQLNQILSEQNILVDELNDTRNDYIVKQDKSNALIINMRKKHVQELLEISSTNISNLSCDETFEWMENQARGISWEK